MYDYSCDKNDEFSSNSRPQTKTTRPQTKLTTRPQTSGEIRSRPQTSGTIGSNRSITNTSIDNELYQQVITDGLFTRPNELYYNNKSNVETLSNKIEEFKKKRAYSMNKIEVAVEHTIMKGMKDPYLKYLKTMGDTTQRPKFTFTKNTIKRAQTPNKINKNNDSVDVSTIKYSNSTKIIKTNSKPIKNLNSINKTPNETDRTEKSNIEMEMDEPKTISDNEENDSIDNSVQKTFNINSTINKYKLAYMKANILARTLDRKETNKYYTKLKENQMYYEHNMLKKSIIGENKRKLNGKIMSNTVNSIPAYSDENEFKRTSMIRTNLLKDSKENMKHWEKNTIKTHRIVNYNYYDTKVDRNRQTKSTFKDTLKRAQSAKFVPNTDNFYNSISGNRLASKFNPDSLYDIKSMKYTSDGSTTILEKDFNPIRGILNSNYLQAYFTEMNEEDKNNYRLRILKELVVSKKKELNNLSLKLIKYCETNTVTENNHGVFKYNLHKSVKEIALKYNSRDFPTDYLTRLLQFYSYQIGKMKDYRINMMMISYSLYLHSIPSNDISCLQAFTHIVNSIPVVLSNNFYCDLKIELVIPHKQNNHYIQFTNIKFFNGIYSDDDNTIILRYNYDKINGIYQYNGKFYYFSLHIVLNQIDELNKVEKTHEFYTGRSVTTKVNFMNENDINNNPVKLNTKSKKDLRRNTVFVKNLLNAGEILERTEKNIDFTILKKSEIRINVYVSNENRPMERKRLIETLSSMFLNAQYKQQLTSKLAEICDSSVDKLDFLTRDYILNKLYYEVQKKDKYNIVYEMVNYLDEFYAAYYYNERSLMQNFKSKIIVGKTVGNVNRTADAYPFVNQLENMAQDMEKIRELKTKCEETIEYKSRILL